MKVLLVIAAVVLLLALWAKSQRDRARKRVVAGQLGPSADYYRDRTLRTALQTSSANPWGQLAIACSLGPDAVTGSAPCRWFRQGLVTVENAVLQYIPIPGARKVVDQVAYIEGRAFEIVKPIASYPAVKAKDVAFATAHGLGAAAGAVGGAVGAGAAHAADAAKDAAEWAWDKVSFW